jgi:hypothetical protein
MRTRFRYQSLQLQMFLERRFSPSYCTHQKHVRTFSLVMLGSYSAHYTGEKHYNVSKERIRKGSAAIQLQSVMNVHKDSFVTNTLYWHPWETIFFVHVKNPVRFIVLLFSYNCKIDSLSIHIALPGVDLFNLCIYSCPLESQWRNSRASVFNARGSGFRDRDFRACMKRPITWGWWLSRPSDETTNLSLVCARIQNIKHALTIKILQSLCVSHKIVETYRNLNMRQSSQKGKTGLMRQWQYWPVSSQNLTPSENKPEHLIKPLLNLHACSLVLTDFFKEIGKDFAMCQWLLWVSARSK